MGTDMVWRLLLDGHHCAVYDLSSATVRAVVTERAAAELSCNPEHYLYGRGIAEIWRRGSEEVADKADA
jgi:6-phosphogluconate dehydrogenase (decarboxylating)